MILLQSFQAQCDSKNWPIWTKKVPKEASFNVLKTCFRCFSKLFCSTWTVSCQRFDHYIHMKQRECVFCDLVHCISLKEAHSDDFCTSIWYLINHKAVLFSMRRIWNTLKNNKIWITQWPRSCLWEDASNFPLMKSS